MNNNGYTVENTQNLYCRGLPSDMSLSYLEMIFQNFGTLSSTKLVGNGVAFVRFDDPMAAQEAIRHVNGKLNLYLLLLYIFFVSALFFFYFNFG